MAACNKMLNTNELLEDVLLHLPVKDLLFAQKVSKTWLATVRQSLKIQEALFFTARGDTGFAVQQMRCQDNWMEPPQWRCQDGRVLPPTKAPILNPLADGNILKASSDDPIYTSIVHKRVANAPGSDRNKTSRTAQRAVDDAEATWRQMQLFQPKVRRVDFNCLCGKGANYDVQETGPTDCYFIKNENGVTLGDAVDVVRAHWKTISTRNGPPNFGGFVDGFHNMDWWIWGSECAAKVSPTITGWELLCQLKEGEEASYVDGATLRGGVYFGDKEDFGKWKAAMKK